MTDLDIVKNAIIAWINAQSNWSVWWENQNFPSIEPPYLTTIIANVENLGLPYLSKVNEEGNRLLLFDRRIVVRLNGFGDGALSEVNKLFDTLHLRETIDQFYTDGIAFTQMLAINDVSRLLEATMQDHVVADLVFRFRPSLSENIGFVQSVEAEGTFLDAGQNELKTIDINVGG